MSTFNLSATELHWADLKTHHIDLRFLGEKIKSQNIPETGQLAPKTTRPTKNMQITTRPRFRRQLAPLRNIINVYYYCKLNAQIRHHLGRLSKTEDIQCRWRKIPIFFVSWRNSLTQNLKISGRNTKFLREISGRNSRVSQRKHGAL